MDVGERHGLRFCACLFWEGGVRERQALPPPLLIRRL